MLPCATCQRGKFGENVDQGELPVGDSQTQEVTWKEMMGRGKKSNLRSHFDSHLMEQFSFLDWLSLLFFP